jgi:hypothetical protein
MIILIVYDLKIFDRQTIALNSSHLIQFSTVLYNCHARSFMDEIYVYFIQIYLDFTIYSYQKDEM